MVSLKTETLVARRVPTKQITLLCAGKLSAPHDAAETAETIGAVAKPPSAQSKGSFGDRPQPEAAQ
jgi:hypothetical protein